MSRMPRSHGDKTFPQWAHVSSVLCCHSISRTLNRSFFAKSHNFGIYGGRFYTGSGSDQSQGQLRTCKQIAHSHPLMFQSCWIPLKRAIWKIHCRFMWWVVLTKIREHRILTVDYRYPDMSFIPRMWFVYEKDTDLTVLSNRDVMSLFRFLRATRLRR